MKLNKKRGFTLVELIGAIIVILILCTIVLVVNGTARTKTMQVRVSADLEAINTAKAHWRLDHPNSSFPSDDTARFTSLQPYLDTVQATSWTSFQPQGVTYYINGLGVNAGSNPTF